MTIAAVQFDPDELARGGRVSALVDGLVGLRFVGNAAALQEAGEKD